MCSRKGKRQSPIALTFRKSIIEYDKNRLQFINYDAPLWDWFIVNVGTTVKIKPNEFVRGPGVPMITGKDLNGTFVAQYMCFHWAEPGHCETYGAEHILEEKQYSMEIQIVHTNIKYSSMAEARRHKDGIAIIAMLALEDPLSPPSCDLFVSFSYRLEYITEFNSGTYVPKNFCLMDFIVRFFQGFYYTYEGSLTCPPYSEAVTWIVFGQPIKIPPCFFVPFRRLRDINSDLISNRISRPIQPREERLETLSFFQSSGKSLSNPKNGVEIIHFPNNFVRSMINGRKP